MSDIDMKTHMIKNTIDPVSLAATGGMLNQLCEVEEITTTFNWYAYKAIEEAGLDFREMSVERGVMAPILFSIPCGYLMVIISCLVDGANSDDDGCATGCDRLMNDWFPFAQELKLIMNASGKFPTIKDTKENNVWDKRSGFGECMN